MMVNKNNKSLDLDNGDSGLLVTFKDDSTIYFMTAYIIFTIVII